MGLYLLFFLSWLLLQNRLFLIEAHSAIPGH